MACQIECDSGWKYFAHSRMCYKSITTQLTRADAIKACKASKSTANLASIQDMTTNAFVQSMVSWRSWIGLQKVNGAWVWDDGTKTTLTNWVPKQPSGDGSSVEMFADKEGPGKWNDLSSNNKRGAVCQYEGCFKAGDYHGGDLSGNYVKYGVTSPESCQILCQKTNGCNYFTWHNEKSTWKNNCYLKSAAGSKGLVTSYADKVTSGPRNC